LISHRTTLAVRDRNGTMLAEIVDDVVTAIRDAEVIRDFREVEVEVNELDHCGGELLSSLTEALVAAGCRREPAMPKLIRALGVPQDATPVRIGRKSVLSDVIRSSLASSVTQLKNNDARLRLGEDIEDVHQFRVATRRLRSDLKTFATVLDAEWAAGLRTELAWLGTIAGAVRDADVLAQRLRRHAHADLDGGDVAAADRLIGVLRAQHEQARQALLDAVRSTRYDELLETLDTARLCPRFAEEAGDAVGSRADKSLSRLVRRDLRRFVHAVEAADDAPSDVQLHQIRIHAKRCRHAAEVAAPVLGKRARRLARAMEQVQTTLGEDHDCVVGEGWLRETVGNLPQSGIAAGLLIGSIRSDRHRLAARWRRAVRDGVQVQDERPHFS
jgi:CHAD domain-containing protein